MNGRVRLGLWGCGAMGAYHAQRFGGNLAVDLVACWDRDSARAAALAAKVGFRRVASNFEQLIEGCDAVSVALVDSEHAMAADRIAAAGLALFLEKPMGRNAAETAALAGRFAEKGLPLVLNFSKRNAPALNLARTRLTEGRLGSLTEGRFSYLQSWLVDQSWGDWRSDPRWQWRTTEAASCHGVLGDLGSHLFDAAAYLLGGPIGFTGGIGRRTPREGQLGGAWDEIRLQAGIGGLSLSFEASRRAVGHLDDLIISLHGPLGRLDLDLGARKDQALWTPVDGPAQSVRALPVVSTYDAFVAVVAGRELGITPPGGAEGYLVQGLIDEAHLALAASEAQS